MWITFSKQWGQDDNRWNYCGGDWNFLTKRGFMDFYGIKKAYKTGNSAKYYVGKNNKIGKVCYEHTGYCTKNLDLIQKHWKNYCNPCTGFSFYRINTIL